MYVCVQALLPTMLPGVIELTCPNTPDYATAGPKMLPTILTRAKKILDQILRKNEIPMLRCESPLHDSCECLPPLSLLPSSPPPPPLLSSLHGSCMIHGAATWENFHGSLVSENSRIACATRVPGTPDNARMLEWNDEK